MPVVPHAMTPARSAPSLSTSLSTSLSRTSHAVLGGAVLAFALTLSVLVPIADANPSSPLPTLTLPHIASGVVSAPSIDTSTLITVDFKGGSVLDYIHAVEAAADTHRVVAMPGVETAAMPPVHLTDIAFDAAINVLNNYRGTTHGSVWELDVDRYANVFTVSYFIKRGSHVDLQMAVWNLSTILDADISADDALTAVELALEMVGENKSIRFHEETALLIAHGSTEQIHAIHQVIDKLLDRSKHILSEAMEAEVQERTEVMMEDMKTALHEIQSGVGEKEHHIDELEHALEQSIRMQDKSQKTIERLSHHNFEAERRFQQVVATLTETDAVMREQSEEIKSLREQLIALQTKLHESSNPR